MDTAVLPPVSELGETPGLPDPFTTFGGDSVDSVQDWNEQRRPELERLFRHYIYGFAPVPPAVVSIMILEDVEILDGAVRYRELAVEYGGPQPLHLALFGPLASAPPTPVLLNINPCGNHSLSLAPEVRRSTAFADGPCQDDGTVRGQRAERWPIETIARRGYTLATFHESDIDPDNVRRKNEGVRGHYELSQDPELQWGTIAAWAWGISRAVDALEDVPGVDPSKIVTVGHSRRGKAALLAAATDDRIAATIPHQSGTLGATLSRSYLGESVAVINVFFPHWFNENAKLFADRETYLPVDQHLLLGLVAPRPLLITNGADDDWADPPGALAAAEAADAIYEFLGSEGLELDGDAPKLDADLSWVSRPGGHSLEAADWDIFMDFVDARVR